MYFMIGYSVTILNYNNSPLSPIALKIQVSSNRKLELLELSHSIFSNMNNKLHTLTSVKPLHGPLVSDKLIWRGKDKPYCSSS